MGPSGQSQRWQGQRSAFSWEQSALEHIKAQMPNAEPYRAWQTFTFTADRGHVREVDLFIATPGGLFLVEIKSHPGTATNDGSTWLFRDGDKTRTIENPLHFTDQKAKELKSQLEKAARKLHVREPLPRVEAVVFLSAETLRCRLDEFQRQRVYGRDEIEDSTGLPGIWTGFLNQPPRSERNRVTPTLSKQLPKLLHEIGIARLHRIGRVGPYELGEKSFDSGPTWEDYLATNPSLPTDYPRRVRVFLTERTATDEDRKSVQRAAHREYLALQGISHDGIVRAEAYSDELLAGPAVVFRHGTSWQRLDHFVSGHPDLALDTRLQMIRQLAEALDHAHRRHLYHRALAPRSVYVELDGRYPRLRIADWQVAARPDATTGGTARTRPSSQTALPGGAAALLAHIERSAGPYLAPEFASPESPGLLDVFGLGALSYLILTGQPPAATRGELATRLTQARALLPSAVIDSVSPAMDTLVRDATQIHQADRTDSVRQFLRRLDAIEEELTAPEADPEQDPLAAGVGDEIAGWTVVRQLGTGSTAKALLVSKDGYLDRVFKVALNAAASSRLEREAAQLSPLNDSHVARLLDPPFQTGPEDSRRTVIGVEYVGDHTLAEELRLHSPLTIHELERLGEDLFQAITFLDRRGIWHRDIKPDNLALRKLDRKGRELVLFDFSLAGIGDTDLIAGTRGYLDPFLGTASRQRYDQAAELYAVAVTLHEMASGELPAWGDDLADTRFLDPAEEAQLAEDLFDPVARDGLVEFFKIALHRDAAKRFGTLHDMTRAWTDIFRDLEAVPPLTTASTDGEDETETADPVGSARTKRAEAAAKATPATPLAAAGLSPYALSIAQQRLGIGTAGDLALVPARRITALRGIGSVPRYELVRRSREWRQRFSLTEAGSPRADVQWAEREKPAPVRGKDLSNGRAGLPPILPPSPETAEELARLSVDEIVRRLIPESPLLAQVIGLAADGDARRVSPWAAPLDIARATGLSDTEVTARLDRLRSRWQKSVKALTSVRDDLAEILRAHGRVLGWRQLAAGLLARRGAEIGDPAERLRLAAICVRAAVETEERLESARLASRRLAPSAGQAGSARSAGAVDARVIVALTDTGEEGAAPRADDLFAYAELLGEQADALSARDPLPGVTEIRQVLREVDTADHALRLSDTDLVLLAAAASEKSAATPRLELYPRDLPAERAVKISQVGSIAEGTFAEELVRRVLARFPDLDEPNRPTPDTMPALLASLGYDVTRGSDSRLHLWPSTSASGASGSRSRTAGRPASSTATTEAAEHAMTRLTQARQRGGFIALKAPIRDAVTIGEAVAAVDGVTPVNVTAEFVRTLRAIVVEQGRPQWETVLAADSSGASPAARTGFTQLLQKTWIRLEEHIRPSGNGGIVLLHDATPLARYTGGTELLTRLTVAARDAAESPVGLWLLCPMEDPQAQPQLDRVMVSVIPGDAEQLYLPGEFADSGGKDLEGIMIDLKALQKQVDLLEKDLKPTGLASDRLKVEWRAAKSADRTAATFETWIGERVTQVAVAWVLATVFVRFCEDNGLIEYPFIAGPGDRVQLAADLQQKYYEEHPASDDRGWLEAAFAALSVSPVAAGLFDCKHNPMWTILPSPHAVKALLDFWRQTGEDSQICYDLTDPEWDTRFLGDLYQDLSESARKTYALLQTPEFVEEFILDYTLDPAIEEFGLEPAPPVGHEHLPPGLRLIDPACGSGHFLLGAFRRLLSAWETQSPMTDRFELVAKALSSVHGVDKNPFAASIARFRLMLAAMRAADLHRLAERIDFPLNIAVGDSLLHGKGAPGHQGKLFGEETGAWTYRTEDVGEYIKSCHILEYGTYHAVVANPPYITVKDRAEKESIRERYESCSGMYALSVPFVERIFGLAVLGIGYTGQITANSFMKREFGKNLIEWYFPQVDLTHVIDTSGAYIPSHGTPTVILIGRHRFARSSSTIRAVLGIRGEQSQPEDPAQGMVWRAIIDQVDMPGTQSEWVSVDDLPRRYFSTFPWSLSGGGAGELSEILADAPNRLGAVAESVGFMAVTREDDAYFISHGTAQRMRLSEGDSCPISGGSSLRDWQLTPEEVAIFPYSEDGKKPLASESLLRHLWKYRTHLGNRKSLSGTQEDRGLPWFTYSDFHANRWAAARKIGFAFVATSNQFVSVQRGNLLIRTAPMIKLPESATEDDHLALLGVLNSSAACFWLKQVSHDKGNRGGERSTARFAWENFYEFTGTKLEQFPLPEALPLEFGREIDNLAQELTVAATHEEDERIRGRMIALQEELDWDVYRRYGLLTDEQAAELVAAPGSVPNLRLGERAFEIVLAGQVDQDEGAAQWFARHRSVPITDVPKEWPNEYRRVVERRIEVIESNRNIGLIERPECKRRWQSEPWEVREASQLTTWLLDRCEERSLWYDGGEPRPMTVNRLADRLRADAEVVAVARQFKGPDADLADVLKEIIADEHVPFLAAHRYKPSGLDKRAQWERTWDLQREEDATGKRLDIAVPPKYVGADFQKQSYWRHRGKLDVPKERFVSYPSASPESDKDSLLVGWAGWDHKDQATALIGLIEERSTTDGWDTGRLTSLLAGLLEVMPWVRQWHHERDPAFGQSPADAYDTYLTSEREAHNLTEDALRTWRPPQAQRGRRLRS